MSLRDYFFPPFDRYSSHNTRSDDALGVLLYVGIELYRNVDLMEELLLTTAYLLYHWETIVGKGNGI